MNVVSKSKAFRALQTVCAVVLCAACLIITSAQQRSDEQRSRGLSLGGEFTGARPAAKSPQVAKPTGTSSAIPAKPIYRPATPAGQSAAPAGNSRVDPSRFAQVGVTIWRLRPSSSADGGARLLVQEGASATTELTPVRVEADTPMRVGDRVRLSIESPRTGYLYVVDREQYADGTLGDPYLIFPTKRTRGGDNRVQAGRLIDIPAQEDRPNYFTLKPGRADQIGEMLTVLITPALLEDLAITDRPLKLSSEQILRWEGAWGATQGERYEMEGGAGRAWTKEEQAAGGTTGRMLTQEEPAPQTIYSVPSKSGSPVLITLTLRYVKSSASG